MLPMNIAPIRVLVKVRVARRFRFLKLGYLTLLIIIIERRSRTTGRPYFQLPVTKSRSDNQIMRSVKDATNAAAAGIGNPRKSLLPPPPIAARQLKRAN